MIHSPAFPPMHYFVRWHDILREVHPLTYPNRENRKTVLVRMVKSGLVFRVDDNEIVRFREKA